MVSHSQIRRALLVTLGSVLLSTPAHALITLNDGTDHIYFTGTAALTYDTNIFAHNGGASDTIYSAGLLAEYARRAGLIGVDASVGVNFSRFDSHTEENFNNPRLAAEFSKSTGPTTGKLALGAARESQADVLEGARTDSWIYDADLNFKHPVIERYSIAGHLGFSDRIYDDTEALANLQTYTTGADLQYAIDAGRNLFAGYQFRRNETSAHSSYDDQSFTVGVDGRIMSKLRGSLRAGYEVRTPTGSTPDGDYRGLTAAASVSWTFSTRLTLTGELAKDVAITADDLSVDTTSAGLTLVYVVSDRCSFSGNAGVGKNRFLGAAGAGRHDEYFTFGGGVKYKLLQHLDAALYYVYDDNVSTVAFSDFTRSTFTFTLSSRW